MLVTLEPSVTLANPMHKLNASAPMAPPAIIAFVRYWHALKAFVPISVTLPGIVRAVTSRLANALGAIAVTGRLEIVVGIVTETRAGLVKPVMVIVPLLVIKVN